MSLDLRNLAEFPLQSPGTLQRGLTQGVGRFEHDERLLSLGKYTIEFERGARDGIAGYDESFDRGIIGYPQGSIYARRGEDQECAGDPGSRTKNVEEELNNLG